ncbi:hypothetical protein DFH07DRAFT_769680 [Mycena maculata]|uniref:Uncharacterized protein n=1 Tax=Mycena maculata TaxID=230809 RepID=A0AAD7NMB1_9AGAR|nr:hypothetical protein DFH07DRAFT_769680 [Mycena maculata]
MPDGASRDASGWDMACGNFKQLYVFGGQHNATRMGCNLFVELNLSTRKMASAQRDHPHHKAQGFFVSMPAKERTILGDFRSHPRLPDLPDLYREAAHFNNEPHGSELEAIRNTDFWSWSMKDEVWRQEGMSSNPSVKIIFPYSYFADTFMYDMAPDGAATREPTLSALKWKHILTPGFPTCRCQAQLACDPAPSSEAAEGCGANMLHAF